MATKVPNVTLANGVDVPILGFGVYQIPSRGHRACRHPKLEVGYRHIDTAAAYFNEEGLGRAIKNSDIPRDELFVTTKIWINDGGEDWARRALDASLQRLGLDYLDLYLIHQPFGDYYSSWRAMEDLHRQGVLRASGVSNFYPDRLVDLIDHTPAVNLFADPSLTAIGAAHGKSVAQVVLRWLIQRDVIVIPKSVRRERMAENFDVFGFELSPDEMARLATMDTGTSLFLDHRDPAWVSQLGSFRAD